MSNMDNHIAAHGTEILESIRQSLSARLGRKVTSTEVVTQFDVLLDEVKNKP